MNIQNDIQDTLEYYIQKAPKLDSGYKQKTYAANSELIPTVILLKYQNYCNNIELDLTKFKLLKSNYVLTDELSSSQINRICDNFKKCLNSGSNIISFRVTIASIDTSLLKSGSTHANIMIYKSNINTFQYFEPHGANYLLDSKYTERIDNILNKLFIELAKRKIIPPNWKYDNSQTTCPTSIGRGFQILEGNVTEKCYGEENIEGFCVSWSNFILEMYLKYPTLPIREVLSNTIKAFNLIQFKDKCAYQKFIAAYDTENYKYLSGFLDNKYTFQQLKDYDLVEKIEKQLVNKYFKTFEDKEPQAPLEKYTQKKKYKQVGTCVNIKTGTVNDVVQYILATPDNIVIAVDDFIGCYKRSDIIGDLKDYKFTEINNIRIEFLEDSSGNLSPIRKLNKKDRVNILHKNIEYHRIYPDMYVSDEDFKKLKNFNNVFFNFVLQYENFYPTIYKVLSYTLDNYLMEEEEEKFIETQSLATNVSKTMSETNVSKTMSETNVSKPPIVAPKYKPSVLEGLNNPLVFNRNTNIYYD